MIYNLLRSVSSFRNYRGGGGGGGGGGGVGLLFCKSVYQDREGQVSHSMNHSVAWCACEAVLGKEKYDRLNGRKTGTSVP